MYYFCRVILRIIATITTYTFTPQEKLKSTKAIAALFAQRKFIQHGKVRLYFLEYPVDEAHIQWAFSVSKKSFPSAVDRNTIKRRMREIVRITKVDILVQIPKDKKYICLITCLSKENLPNYKLLEADIGQVMAKFIKLTRQ